MVALRQSHTCCGQAYLSIPSSPKHAEHTHQGGPLSQTVWRMMSTLWYVPCRGSTLPQFGSVCRRPCSGDSRCCVSSDLGAGVPVQVTAAVLVAWGSREDLPASPLTDVSLGNAGERAEANKTRTGTLHLRVVWPFPY